MLRCTLRDTVLTHILHGSKTISYMSCNELLDLLSCLSITLGDKCIHLHAWVPVHVYSNLVFSNPYPHLSSSSSSVLIHQQSSIVNHHCPIYSLFSLALTPDDSELHLQYHSLEVGGYTITLLHSYAHSTPPGIIPQVSSPRYHTHQLLHSRSKISLTYPLPSTALVNPYSENR